MYALVEILGKQYKVEEGQSLQVDLLNMEEGSSYETDKVLAVIELEAGCVQNYILGSAVNDSPLFA